MELGITGVKVQQNVRSDKKPQLQLSHVQNSQKKRGQSSIRIKTQTIKSKIVKTNSDRQIQQKQNVKIIKKLEEGFKLPPIPRVNKFTKNISAAKNSTQTVQPNSILQSKQLQKRNSVQKKQIQEQDQQAELILQKENQKIHQFFRFKLATLMHVLDFPQYYDGSTAKTVNQQNMESILFKLKKLVSIRSKYRYRQKCQFYKSQILSTLDVNMSRILEKMIENQQILDQIYNDLDDEQSEEKKVQNKKKKIEKLENQPLHKKEVFFNIDGLNHYKKKKGLQQNSKVFIIAGGYQSLRKQLIELGWYENPDKDSLYFDLKWTLRTKDIDFGLALDCQFINHVSGNGSISSKQSFAKNLKNLIWFENIDFYDFFPKCYDLNDQQEFEDFIEEFKFTKAESILKKFQKENREVLNDIEMLILQICVVFLNRRSKFTLSKIEEINVGRYPTIQKDEWKLIKQWPNLKQNLKVEKIQKIKNNLQGEFENGQQELQDVITQCLNKQKDYNPQYNMQGENNIWVIKPAGLSRGRGIRSFQDLEPIFEYIFSKDIQWVAQKYMENLYLIDGKKFDLRQWVLVTDFNPLTIFYYDECYARICSEKYDVNDLNNKYAQIVNQCIQKKKQNFDEEKEDTTMTQDEFKAHLIKNEGSDKFQSIKKKMIKAIISSLKSVADSVQYRKNSFEFLGYDFMIDDQLNPWLIEINTSPSMEYTTSVTKRLVQMGLADTAKLINNYLFNNRNIQKNTDIGNWKFCYREQKDQK